MIRAFQLRDSRLVARLQQVGTPLDIEEQLTHPRSPLRSVLLDTLFSPRTGPSTIILDQQDENGRLLGLAQMRPRPGGVEREVIFLAPALDTAEGSHAIWQRLLTHLCVQAAERGALRLYARLPVASDELQLFKNVGFVEYVQQHIYRLGSEVNRIPVKTGLELRHQRASDGWGLQKLYASVAPRPVQKAEGLAQGRWELAARPWEQRRRLEGYVWEVDGELLAALHILAGNRGYLIRTLLHPQAVEQAEALGQAALNLAVIEPHLPVYFTFRQYEAGWSHLLPGLGFEPFTTQVMVVKHMAVRVRNKPSILMALDKSTPEGAATSMVSRSEILKEGPFRCRYYRN